MKNSVFEIQKLLDSKTAALITSEPNRFYITGFETSAGAVVVTQESAYFLIDFRYFEKAKEVVKSCEVLLSSNQKSEIFDILKEKGVKKLLLESEAVSVSEFAALTEAFEGVEVSRESTLSKCLTELRSVKDKDELALIMKAQELTDKTFEYICERISEGRTEREVMLDMEFFMRKLGSEGVSFDFIVVSGKNSSLPHGVPTDKKIEKGDFITMDFGAVVDGYRSDMTRTVALGNITDEQKRVYETVLKAQLEAIKAIKAGVRCKDIDKVARDIIYSAGFEGCFGHGLGHSVGIEIHESPNFNMRCETILKAGTVMTVEPGIYLENKFGVRIEDMIWTTENGCKNLTASPKNLIIL